MEIQRSAIRSRLVVGLAALCLCVAAPLYGKETVTLDHQTQMVVPGGTIGLYADELLELVVTNTDRDCYTFNLEVVEEEPEGAKLQGRDPKTTVVIPVIHHAGVSAYEVVVRKLANLPGCSLPDHTFRVPVETYEWRLAIAGAFTGDRLTDPVFYLEDGIENPEAPEEMQRQGFFVRQSTDAEDSYSLGAAAMVHLFHNDPFRFDFKWRDRSRPPGDPVPGAGLVHWAPLSFGLGVGEDSDTRYYVGSSLRFGQKAYLTAGWVFGSRNRLPDGLDVGDFTTEVNALGSLGSKTTSAFFLGLSFDFIDVGASSFMGPFQTANPEPTGKKRGSVEGANAKASEQDAGSQIRDALNETGAKDPFKDDAIFKPDSDGDRFCSVTITEDPPGVTVEVNLESLIDPKVVTNPDASEDLTGKKAQIQAAVAEAAAAHFEGTNAEDVDVTLDTCSES